jgi:hypothetical protein
MKLANFLSIGDRVEPTLLPVDESYFDNKKKDIIELNNLIAKEDKFKKFVKDKKVCFNCEHNLRLYLDKGECQEHGQTYNRLYSCEKFKKRE